MKKTLLYIGGIGLIGYGIYRYYAIEKSLLENYDLQIVDIGFNGLSSNNVNMNLTAHFTSKADVTAKVSQLYIDVLINGQHVGTITNTAVFNIPAHGSVDIPMNLSFNPQIVVANALNILLSIASNKDMPVEMTGYAKIKSGFIGVSYPIDYKTTVKNFIG